MIRRLQRLPPLEAGSTWDLARAFVALPLWPYLVEHPPSSSFTTHYHLTDEQLQVTRGSMTFVDVNDGGRVDMNRGDRVSIPEGTVHAATVGADGVEYVMGLGRPMALDTFPVFLPESRLVPEDVLAGLVDTNYEITDAEEQGTASRPFFEKLLSPRFVFTGAFGDRSMNRADFIAGLEQRKGKGRRSSGLRLHTQGSAVGATILVTTADGGMYFNMRLFEPDADGTWKCTRWSNAQAKPPA